MYARGTLVGFPLHVKSPARRRPLLRSKSAAPKRKTPVGVSFFLWLPTGFVVCTPACCKERNVCKRKLRRFFLVRLIAHLQATGFATQNCASKKASNQMFLFSAMWLQFDIFSLCNALPIYKFTEKIHRRRPQEILSIHISIRLYEYNFDSFSNHIAFDK